MTEFFKLGTTLAMSLFSYGITALIAGITLFSIFTKKHKRPKIVTVFLFALILFMIWLLIIVPNNAGIEIKRGEMKISIPLSAKITITPDDVVSCKIIDWNENTEYKPAIRTFGTSIGNYRVGSFKLKNGKTAKMLTIGDKAIAIELKNESYLLLLAPKDFDDFVKAIDDNFIEVIR